MASVVFWKRGCSIVSHANFYQVLINKHMPLKEGGEGEYVW